MPKKRAKQRKVNNLYLTFKFVSLFLALSLFAYLVLSLTNIPNLVAAYTSQLALKVFFNLNSALILNGQFPLIQTPNLLAQIVDLCSGKIELAVMFGIIFASFEKRMGYRVKGFLLGVLVMLAFNAIRIATTIYYFDVGALEWTAALHDFLFRMFLIIVIVTYYAIWYYYDLPRKASKRSST
ncbi:MAG: exosortase/archaeosortase family protein [Candidatus Micrarchaeota archaeon]